MAAQLPLSGQSLGDRPVRGERTLGSMGNRPHCDKGKEVPTGTLRTTGILNGVSVKLNITDPFGIVVLSDKENRALTDPENESQRQSMLPEAAKNGNIFYIDREDPIKSLPVEICTEFPNEPGYSLRFSPLGGSFLLHAPTGELVLSGLASWADRPEQVEYYKVNPGAYTVSVYSSEEMQNDLYERDMTRLLGADDWKYRNSIDRLYLIGCLPTILAVVVTVFAALTVSVYFMALAALLWGPYFAARFSKRYRAIEKKVNTYEKQLPLFVLHLSRIENPSGVIGGYIR